MVGRPRVTASSSRRRFCAGSTRPREGAGAGAGLCGLQAALRADWGVAPCDRMLQQIPSLFRKTAW